MSAVQQAVSKLLIKPIAWEKYRLSDDDIARMIDPLTLVDRTMDALNGVGDFEGLTLPWGKTHDTVRLRRGKVYLWTGETHHGKTQILKQVMQYLMSKGEIVCIASMEELPEETFGDMARQGLPGVNIDREWVDVFAGWCSQKLWLYDQQGMINIDRILALMVYAAKEKRCTQFVLDSLMRIGVPADDYEMQRVVFNRLDNHAKALNMTLHVVCHMRKPKDEGEVGGIYNVRGGGAIVEQATGVFVVWRDMREDRAATDPSGLLGVVKQRGRPNWLGRIKLWHEPKSGQFLGDQFDGPAHYMPGKR